jgi:hypothetical protein
MDIADTREKLAVYFRTGLLGGSDGTLSLPQPGAAKKP